MPMNSAWDTACAVGCPIRRSRDQRSLASPPGFSQRATSFIASQCQGIHQMPFSCFTRHTQRQTSRGSVRIAHGQPNDAPAKAGAHQVRHSSPFRRHFVTEPTGQGNPGRGFRRGHNSLLYNCPSTPPRPPAEGRRGNSVILPRCPSGVRPLSAHRRCACRAAKAWLSPGLSAELRSACRL